MSGLSLSLSRAAVSLAAPSASTLMTIIKKLPRIYRAAQMNEPISHTTIKAAIIAT